MAIRATVTGSSVQQSLGALPQHKPLGFLPSSMHIPDLYHVDVERDPMKIAEPIDDDRYVSLDLVPRPIAGWTASFIWDGESRRRGAADSGQILRLWFEYNF